MSNAIPGWFRVVLIGGAVAAGLSIAVLFLVPTDDPSPYVVPPTVRRPPPESVMRPLASARVVEERSLASPHIVEGGSLVAGAVPMPNSAMATTPAAAGLGSLAPAAQVPAPAPTQVPGQVPARVPAPVPAVTTALAHPVVVAPPVAMPVASAPGRPAAPVVSAEPAKPSFDVVTMSTEGSTVIAGRAVPDSDVVVRNGDTDLGHVKADQRGNWVLLPDKKLAEGPQTLTLAERLPNGAEVAGSDHVDFVVPAAAPKPVVTADASAVVRAAAGETAAKPGSQVVVQPGENLWNLAKSAYGSGPRYIVIYRANQNKIREPDRIYPGQELAVPVVAQGVASAGSSVMPDSSIKSR